MKRSVDLFVSAIGLVATAPLLLAISLAVRKTMGPPVLFRQARPGKDGVIFELVKFRTMHVGEGSDEERLAKLGRFLRSSSLDELPELWNVLRGEMSLVGPRPLLPEYLPFYTSRQRRRHEVRPGLTGLAQVSGRNASTWEKRLELDVQYVEQAGLVLDLRILARTIRVVFSGEGVAAEGQATMSRFDGLVLPEDET